MAFLFKSKKNQNSGGLPPAARNIHTSEGTTGTNPSALVNGAKEREKDGGAVQSPTLPNAGLNNSLNSGPGSPDQPRFRQRAESESQVSTDVFSFFPYKPTSRMGSDLAKVWIRAFRESTNIRHTDPSIPTAHERSFVPQFLQHGPLPMVSPQTQFPHAPSESFPAIWCDGQCGGIKRRRYLHDGRSGRRFNRQR